MQVESSYSFKGVKLLVTGGSGSFGHKVATLAQQEGALVTIFSRDEKKQHDMRIKYPDLRYIIGDVRDYDSVKRAMRGHALVFHAAALKQVPSCELYPEEALKTNCLGAANVCKAAWEVPGVERVVALSTDKAVTPLNVMGISKAMAEKIVTSQPSGGPTFNVVRYGNVMFTRGSVLPVWYSQLRKNSMLTITHPNMTRFLMNLRDSFHLVKLAISYGENGDMLVWKAPAVTMERLAQAVLLRFPANRTIRCKIIGRRPGEKMHETLLCEDELYRTVDFSTFVRISLHETLTSVRCPAELRSDNAPSPANLDQMLDEGEKDMEAEL